MAAVGLALGAAVGACVGDGAPADVGDATWDVEIACAPGERVCIDERTSAVCSPGGDRIDARLACPAGLVCEAASGLCRLPFCEAGAPGCADLTHIQVCSADGRAFDPELTACDPGHSCSGGRCMVCLPDALTCTSDDQLSRCSPDGSGWEVVETCAPGMLCHSPSASCISSECDGESLLCASPNAYRVCRGPEAGWSDAVFACNIQEICTGGACVPCPDGPTRCAPDGRLEVCDAAHGGYVAQACPPMSACGGRPATCGLPPPPYCLADAPDCADASAISQCNGSGNGWQPGLTFCGLGERCSFGACIDEACLGRVMLLVEGSVRMAPDWEHIFAGLQAAVSATPSMLYGLTFFPRHGSATEPPSFPQLPLGHLNGTSVLAAVFSAHPPAGTPSLVEAMERLVEQRELFLGEPGAALVVLVGGAPHCQDDDETCAAALMSATRRLHEQGGVPVYAIPWRAESGTTWADLIARAGGGGQESAPLVADADSLRAALDAIVAGVPDCAGQKSP